MEADPIKRALEAIDQELEDAMLNLSATNERVDGLLNEFSAGRDLTIPRAAFEAEPIDAPDPETVEDAGAPMDASVPEAGASNDDEDEFDEEDEDDDE